MKSRLRYNFIYLMYCLYELRYGKILLNNYGYFPTAITEENAHQLQFYVELMKAGGVPRTEALNLCELGCGQGHGSMYLLRNYLDDGCHFNGLDASEAAIFYCKRKHRKLKNAVFKVNRQGMPFANDTFDVILSVETGVPRFNDQLREIYRSLKPSGSFIFYETYDMENNPATDAQLSRNGFIIIKKINVTPNIVESLIHDNERKLKLLRKLWFLPKRVMAYLNNYSCMVGSKRFERYYSNRRNGFIYVLGKLPELVIGHIEMWDGQYLKGWAYCSNQNGPADLRILVNGMVATETVAGLSRSDVAAAYGSKGLNSGFAAPLDLTQGVTYSVRVIYPETGQEISNSPFTINA
ncbi:MAG: hypothetical protein CTY16_18355 [Methylobacter sp.]|nr:MAG: hypothetical protein CTY16_18355 [Methylobacter sp.]